MPVCSYLAIPEPGRLGELLAQLGREPECQAVAAENHEVLILVTDTPDLEAEETLRRRLEELEDLRLLVFAFGEIDPETTLADPVSLSRKKGRRRPGRPLPVVTPEPAPPEGERPR